METIVTLRAASPRSLELSLWPGRNIGGQAISVQADLRGFRSYIRGLGFRRSGFGIGLTDSKRVLGIL